MPVGEDGTPAVARYELLEKVATVKGARTSLLDAETGRLYLAVPRQAGQEGPTIRVYRPRP